MRRGELRQIPLPQCTNGPALSIPSYPVDAGNSDYLYTLSFAN